MLKRLRVAESAILVAHFTHELIFHLKNDISLRSAITIMNHAGMFSPPRRVSAGSVISLLFLSEVIKCACVHARLCSQHGGTIREADSFPCLYGEAAVKLAVYVSQCLCFPPSRRLHLQQETHDCFH